MPWVIALAAVAAAAVPAVMAATNKPGDPQQRDLSQEARDTLQTQIDLAPQVYEQNAKYAPLYSDLALQQQQRTLLGRPAGTPVTESYTDWEPLKIPAGVLPMPWENMTASQKEYWGNVISSGNYSQIPRTEQGAGATQQTTSNKGTTYYSGVSAPSGGATPTGGYGGEDVLRPVTKTRTIENAPAIPGMLDIFQNDIAPLARKLQTEQRTQDIADVGTLGPAAMENIRKMNPGGTGLVDSLVRNAQTDLDSPGLTPRQQRDVVQNVRAGQAARGFGFGGPDIFQEVQAEAAADEGLKSTRAGRAVQALGANAATYTDPFMQIFLSGTGGAGTASANSLFQGANAVGQTAGPSSIFNPFTAYSADLNNTNYNAQVAAQIAAQNNRAAMTGAGVGAGSSILAGGLAGGYFSTPRYGGGGNSFGLVN